VVADDDKTVDDTSKKVVGTSGPNTNPLEIFSHFKATEKETCQK
jgi:hypothetical protein